MSEARHLLEFWFAPANRPRWFAKDLSFDEEIRRRFTDLVGRAAAGRLAAWQNTPEGSLALVIGLDQLPRNMYRGTPRAFAADAKARAVAEWAVDRDFDLHFKTSDERVFFYLPFMHSEELEDQERCIELVRARCGDEQAIRSAIAHRDCIARYGRFPHRNAILGRPNTPDEEEYLKQPGSGF